MQRTAGAAADFYVICEREEVVKFLELPPIGAEAIEREGDLLELIQSIPYFLVSRPRKTDQV